MIGQENQSRCVQCGMTGGHDVSLQRYGACRTSRYCSKQCQVKYRAAHRTVCMAIQELKKRKATEDAKDDDLNTTFPSLNAKAARWTDKTCGTEVHSEMQYIFSKA